MSRQPQHSKVLSSKSTVIDNVFLVLVLGVLFAAISYLGYKFHGLSAQQEQIKQDYATVNNITFGIFSIDLWTEQLSKVVTGEIKDFKVSPEQKKLVRQGVEAQLHEMVDKVVNEFNKPQKSLGGKLKKFAFKQFVDSKELHAQVPSFAKIIVNRITSPRATGKLKNIALSEFDELADQTYDSTKVAIKSVTRQMFKKYEVSNAAAFNQQIETRLDSIRNVTYNYAYAMLCCAAFAIALWLLLRKKEQLYTTFFVMLLLIALVLLTVGVTTSIIEVDARISSLHILIMGEKISFENQVLFYQSKSILGVAQVLIAQPKFDAVTVGILIILFVIILPVLRMLAWGIHMLCGPRISENGVTRYLAFEAGKWDMADVMVVGILMTYIGLNGILKSQLTDLNIKTEFMESTTINYSSLQPGYLIFVGYVAFGIFLYYMLKRITCKTPTTSSSQ
ncbi:paraquat-inducible protein A [Pedobacter sp. MC2016-14]|uniref:paraquat-inducible protein A n=1 Tax=Pedobacter sp. MC2016-14 TaxID=2897327 RepID=UPI001E6582BC|nr:paraquat-inducible protein A [Pedobacter sp. MC2016-14]MCD0486649.1 paraquat-inducible protein A [Pedobacter sp. MC2016-14]